MQNKREVTLFWVLMAGLVFGLILSIIFAVSVGAVALSPRDVYGTILYRLTGWDIGGIENIGEGPLFDIVWIIRLPRVIMSVIVGMGLALAGVIMQATVQNPLADPYVLGLSSGASLGATFSIMIGASSVFTGFLANTGIAFWGFLGALGVSVLVFLLSSIGGRMTTSKLILSGVVVSSICSAFSNIIIYLNQDKSDIQSVTFWTFGSFSTATWEKLRLPTIALVVCFAFFLTQVRRINIMLLGDEAATTLGIDLNRLRRVYMVLTALLTAVIVCTCGIVGFVGLMIPHFMRAFTGSDYRRLLPATTLFGGLFLIWADIAARTLGASGKEIPIGIITSAIGAPVFMIIMLRRAYGFGGRD
ncbi:MAG: iron ABC transporter permease [Clostridia bacterium]|nr:iron ABC transporter permease [Clostridia bacterium]